MTLALISSSDRVNKLIFPDISLGHYPFIKNLEYQLLTYGTSSPLMSTLYTHIIKKYSCMLGSDKVAIPKIFQINIIGRAFSDI